MPQSIVVRLIIAAALFCAALFALPFAAVAQSVPQYTGAGGAPMTPQGVVCVNPTSGALESCGGSVGGATPVYPAASITTAAGGTPLSTAQNSTGTVFRAAATNLFMVKAVAGGVAGLLMVFDAATVPPDGAVAPVLCLPVAANSASREDFPRAARFSTGVVLVLSSGTDCQTKTAVAAEQLTVQFAQ